LVLKNFFMTGKRTLRFGHHKVLLSCPFLTHHCQSPIFSWVEYSDTIRINRFCEWDEYTFDNIERVIFQGYFDTVKQNRFELENSLSERINGSWFPLTKKRKLNRGEILTLTKDKAKAIERDCKWDFQDSALFKSNCAGLLDLTYSEGFKWDVDEGKIFLVIGPGAVTRVEDGDTLMTIENYGATFELMSLTENDLKLKYLWE
jgi:hypothetical protein